MESKPINTIKLYLTVLSLSLVAQLYGQSTTYEKMLVNNDQTSRYDVRGTFENSDGNIIVYGFQSKNNYDPFYLEVDPVTGDTLNWRDIDGTLYPERLNSLVELPTGGYMGVGYTARNGNEYPWLIKVKDNGDTVFTKSFHNYNNTFSNCTSVLSGYFNDALVNGSGDLMVTGQNDNCWQYATMIAQIDTADGTIDWVKGNRNFNAQGGVTVESYRGHAIIMDGSDYVVVGGGYGGNSDRGTILKFDSSGDTLWTAFASTKDLYDVIKASDGNYYATGESNPFSISNNAAFVKLTSTGSVSQTVHISPSGTNWSYGYSIAEGPNTNEILIGGVTDWNNIGTDQTLHSISTTGTVNYTKHFGFGDWVDRAYVLVNGSDIFLSGSENYGGNAWEYYNLFDNISSNPPHQLRPTISRHTSDGKVELLNLYNNSQTSGGALCQNTRLWLPNSYSNFTYTSSDMSSSDFCCSGWTNEVDVYGSGTVTFGAEDKNGDSRSVDISFDATPNPTIAGYDAFYNITYSACAGDSLLLVATGAAGSSFEWFVDGNNTPFSTNDSVYVKSTTNLHVTETTVNGCIGTTYQNITINTDQVNITSSDYPQKFNSSIGSGTDTNTRQPNAFKWAFNQDIEAWIAPIGGFKQQNAQQYLVKASELSALGLNAGSKISKIGFEFLDTYSTQVREFQIRIKPTSSASLSLWNSFSSVSSSFDDYWYYPSITSGVNYFAFNDDYTWDGTSSLIIQFSYVNDNWSSSSENPRIRMTDVGYDATLIGYGTQTFGLGQSNPPAYKKTQFRPNIYFEAAKAPLQDTIVGCGTLLSMNVENSGYQFLQWSTGSTNSNISVSTSGSYTVQMLDANFCVSIDTVEVLFSNPSVTASASLTKGCDGDNSTITASGAYDTYVWSNGQSGNSITITETGSYTVTAFDEYSCTAKDTIQVEFVESPIIYVGTEASHNGDAIADYVYLGEYNQHHYYYYTLTHNHTWDQAKVIAENMGGYLWSVNSQAEHEAVAEMYQSQNSVCCEAFNGAYKENGIWKWHSGEPFTYTNWAQNEPSNPNGDSRIRVQWGWSDANGIPGQWEDYGHGGAAQKFIIEFPANRRALATSETFCDSVQIWSDQNFDSYSWSTGETDSIITVSASTANAITLTGAVNKSDGTTCSLTSGGTSITINTTPGISITNNTGTTDYDGSTAISLSAGSSGSNTTYEWSTGATTASILVTAEGTYQVVGTENGCSDSVSIQIFEPIYVAKTGDDTNGDGSFSSPYLTINHAIDQASEGDKIYVLPGTYAETVDIDKGVVIHSDVERLGNIAYRDSTTIDGGDGICVKIISQSFGSDVEISGFTLKDGTQTFGDNQGALTIKDSWTSGVKLKNSRITSSADNGECCGNGGVVYAHGLRYLRFENVLFDNNGSSTQEARSIFSFGSISSNLEFINSRIIDNSVTERLIHIHSGVNAYFENVVFYGNEAQWDNQPLIHCEYNPTVIFNHVTMSSNDNNQDMYAISLGGNTTFTAFNSVFDGRKILNTSRDYVISNSFITTGGLSGNGTNNGSDNVFGNSAKISSSNYSLSSTSPAIGIGVSTFTIGGTTYSSPYTDLNTNSRPDPIGSNPDAGAIENELAIGDFDLELSSCGYLLDAAVLNSNAYSVAWMFNGDTVSTSGSFTASALGTYTAYVESTDRSSTLSETISLSDPLRFDLSATNNCVASSSNSGTLYWNNVTGGIRNTSDWWEYTSGINSENGTLVGGEYNIDENSNNQDGRPAGKYYVYVRDNSGCVVGDTVEIIDQSQDTYFVSTAGDNTNDGTTEINAFASIEYAISMACSQDTIIVLDGTYYEDSLEVTRDLVLGSMYLIDGDTNHIANTVIDGEDDGWIIRWSAGSGNWSDTTSNQLVGLTIKNGNSGENNYSGGLSVWNSNVVKVSHVVFEKNKSIVHHGGGMYTHSYSYVELNDVLFKENSADGGGAIMSQNSRMRWLDVEFDNNLSTNQDGMAIWLDNSYTFYSDGVYVHDHDESQVTNAGIREVIRMNMWDNSEDIIMKNWRVQNNSVEARVFSISQQNASRKLLIENALITDNNTRYGGPGLLIRDCRNAVSIVNSTIANNQSAERSNNTGAAAVVIKNAQSNLEVNILNSIVDRATSAYSVAENGGNGFNLNIENSYVSGGLNKVETSASSTLSYASTNVSSGLYFTDDANGDYSLSSVSTLLGAGVTLASVGGTQLTAPAFDLYKNPRPNPAGTNPDLGAIEAVDSIAQVGMAAVVTNNGFCQTTSGAITANLLNYTGTATYSWSSSTYPSWTWNSTQSATGLSSGDYKVVALDATSGVEIDSIEVSVVTLPSISIANTSTDVTCFGDDDGELTFEISGGNPFGGMLYNFSVDYLESLAQADGVILGNSWFNMDYHGSSRSGNYVANNYNGDPIYQGKYYVSVSDQDGCTFTDTVVVGYNHELPQVNITTLASDGTVGLTSMCEGTGNTINLTANVTGGGGTNAFSWSNASTAQTVGVAQTDEYHVEVIDQNTCIGRDTIEIIFQSEPQVYVGAPASKTGELISDFVYLGEFDDHHYYYYTLTHNYTWDQAKVVAEGMGAYLWSVNSRAEHEAVATMYQNQNQVCCEAFIGAFKEGGQWKWHSGEPFNYTNWAQNEPSNPNGETRIRVQWGWWDNQNVPGQWEDYGTGGDQQKYIFEFPSNQEFLSLSETFCDSIEVFAGTSTGVDFDDYFWVNSNSDTIGRGPNIMVSQDLDFKVYGQFVRSDGQSCDLYSSDYSIQINNSPNLEVTALSGTYDFAIGDTLYFLATSDTSGASITWSNSTSTDTTMVTSLGDYTATAAMNGCTVSETFRIEEAIYVAQSGSNITGDGSLGAPYRTIQYAIDTAESGSKIYVLPGTYNENLIIDKQIRMYSDYIRLGNTGAITATVINAGFNGRVIEYSSNTRLDKDSSIIDGFTIKNGDINGDEGSGIYAHWNQGSGLTINNSIISYNRKQCCSDGIAIALHGVDLYLNNVEIDNNGSLIYWDERSTITLRHLKSVWNNVRFRNNEANNSLVYLYDTDLEVHNSDFIGNTVQDNNESVVLVDWGSNLLLNHVTMTNNLGQGYAIKIGNNDDAKVVVHNSLIDGFTQGGIKTAGASNKVYLVNSVVNSTPSSISGNATVQRKNSLEVSSLGLNLDGTLKPTSPAIGFGGAVDTVIAGYTIEIPNLDLAGEMRPNPVGSRPDAGAYEDTLARGVFGIQVSTCGYVISTTVLNSDAYSLSVTSSNGYSSTDESALVTLKGTYNVAVYDSATAQTISKTVSITDPLSIGYLWLKDACSSNGGYGEIVFGDFQGGVDIDPSQQWFDYYLYVYDTNNTYSNNWHVHEGAQSTWNATVQSGNYVIELSDGAGCSVYDTVLIDQTIGSRYYIATTGSDTADGTSMYPLSTVGEALGRACDGDTIILLDGEYFENIEINNLSPFVTIASEMILDGDSNHIANTEINGMDEDPVFEVRNKEYSSDEVVFYGFTVTNGYSSGNWYGGGGFSIQNSDVSFENMIITGNRSSNSGGGIGTEYSRIKITNSIIEDNLSNYEGGGIYFDGIAEVEAVGQVIVRNNKSNSNGGGIAWKGHWDNELLLKNFIIENNEAQSNGGGLYFQNGWGNNGGSVDVQKLIIRNNRSINGVGGAYINSGGLDMTLENSIIAYNKANQTGGLFIENSDIEIVHATIYKNGVLNGTSSNDQIEITNNSSVVFLNSAVGGQEVIGASTAHTIYLNDFDQNCDLTIESSIISGGINSIDNQFSSTITGTPLGQALYLIDPANGDYMLSPVSVGLGAGAASYGTVVIPPLDLNGNARPGTTGQNPDIGAIESPLDSAVFGAAYEIRNNIACDNTYGRLKVVPLNGSGSYKFELEDLTGTATFNDQQNVSSYTYNSLYSGDYEVTITDLSSLTIFTDTVTISGKDSLSIVKDVMNEFCFGQANGSISLSVSGGDGFYDYTWSTANSSGFPKTSSLNNLSPAEYFVSVKDGDNCFIEDSITIVTLHSLPIVSITGDINKGGTTVSTTNPQIRACAGDEVTLDAGAGYVTYNWTTIDQLNSWTTQTLDASYEQGFYVTVIDSFGCTNSDTAEVFYVQAPSVFASNVNTNIGAAMQSVTSYIEGVSQSLGDSYNDAKPYGAGDAYAKMQFIIPASELISEGLTDQTTINSIGFEVSVETGSPIQNFKIKMKNTTANQVSTTFESGLTQVYSLNILTPGEGWNTHSFNEGFVWDGTKNLLVQVEYSNIAFSGGSDHLLLGSDMSYNATSVAKGSSSVQNTTSANFVSTWRPNMKFGIDKVQATDTLRVCDFTVLNTTDDYDTYSWLVNNASQSSLLRYSVNTPLEVVLKTVDAASNCTMYSDTVQVLLDTTPSVFVSNSILSGCIGDTLTVGIDSLDTEVNYSWSNGVIDTVGLFTESGQYYVFATSPSGCQGVDTVSVDINIPPDVVVELNGRVLTSTDGSLLADNSSCDTTLILPYLTTVDTLSMLNSSEWSTYSDEYLIWEYQQGWDSLVDFTGPTYDADSNFNGGFYQFDPASLTDQNKTGYLQLGCVNLLGMSSPELVFDYHMVDVYADSANTSDQMGSLELQVKTASDNNWITIWQRSGTEASYDWVTKSLSLSAYINKTIQLRWKGVAGVGGPRSEMALDNIGINDSLALLSNVVGRATPETVCEGDSLFANAVSNGTSNFSYSWSSGDTTEGVQLINSGWYSVIVTDDKNCSVTTDSVYIEVNPAPDNLLFVSDTTQYCEGLFDSLMISSVSGYEHYQWFIDQGAGYISSDTTNQILVDSIFNGTQHYYVQITDSIGCRSLSSIVDLVQTPTPQILLSSIDVGCNGDSTGMVSIDTVGTGQWMYDWSTGDTTATITDLPVNWYNVTVIDEYFCEASDSIYVDEPLPVILTVTTVNDVDCFGNSSGFADIDFTGGVGGYSFVWTDSTGTWSSSDEDLLNAPAGEYYLSAQDSNGCALFDTVSINEPSELIFSVDSVLDQTCKGFLDGYIGVSATGGTLPYLFNANGTSSTTGQFANLDSNFYLLTVTDSLGCIVTDSAVVSEPPAPYDDEEICVVSVDSTGSNIIVWERTPGVRTASYVILTENASTQYVPAGAQLYADFSTYVDTASNPAVRPYRYRLALIDSCGFISDTSDYHATIHLQASPGVAQNEVQLQWTPYEGKQVQTYYIYRWVDTITRVLVDSVSSNVQTYTDIYPVNTTITALLYEVGAKFTNGGCSPSSGKQVSYVNSISNRLDWGSDGGLPIGTDEWLDRVLHQDLKLFPNPTRSSLNLEFNGAWSDQGEFEIMFTDLTGRVFAQKTAEGEGIHRFDFSELPAGVYFIQIITESGNTLVERFEKMN